MPPVTNRYENFRKVFNLQTANPSDCKVCLKPVLNFLLYGKSGPSVKVGGGLLLVNFKSRSVHCAGTPTGLCMVSKGQHLVAITS